MSALLYFSIDETPIGSRLPGQTSWQTNWAWCEWANCVIYEIEWIAAGAPNGVIALEGNGQVGTPGLAPNAAWTTAIPLPAGSPGTYGAWPTVAGVAGNATVVIANPMRWHRITYTFGSGGDPGGNFTVHRTMRR